MTSRRRRSGAVLATVAVVLTGCASVRSSLGTKNGGCFVALPTASSAVHHEGVLIGAQLAAVSRLRHLRLLERAVINASGPPIQSVCLVAYHGSFTPDRVVDPVDDRSGPFAVVVVEYPNGHLLGTVVVAHPPVRFGHARAGLS